MSHLKPAMALSVLLLCKLSGLDLPVYAQSTPNPSFAWDAFYFPQVADGNSIQTTMVVYEVEGRETDLVLRFTDDQGKPKEMDLGVAGRQSQFELSLDPGETRVLQSQGTGDGRPGAAALRASSGVGCAVIFTLKNEAGEFLAETGIPPSRPRLHFSLPVDTTGDFNTGLALQNSSETAAEVELTLYSEAGEKIEETKVSLAPLGHQAKFVAGTDGLFPGQTSRRGMIIGRSDEPVAAVVLRQHLGRLNLTALPVSFRAENRDPNSEGRYPFFLPQVADGPFSGGMMKTGFVLFNSTGRDAEVTVRFRNDAGEAFTATIADETADRFKVVVPALGTKFLQTDGKGGGSNQLTVGSAVVESDQPIGLSAIFTLLDEEGVFRTESGVAPAAVTRIASVPALNDENTLTGVAIQNLVGGQNNVTLMLFDSKNTSAESSQMRSQKTTELKLDGYGHSASFIHEQFGGIGPGVRISGAEAIRSDHVMSVVAVRQRRDPLWLTIFPVTVNAFSGTPLPESGTLTLSEGRTNVTLAADRELNISLPFAVTLQGRVENLSNEASSAVISSGPRMFEFNLISIDWTEGRFEMPARPGNHSMRVCQTFSQQNTSTVVGQDIDERFWVSGPTTRDVAVPDVVLHEVTGVVQDLEKLPAFDSAWFFLYSEETGTVGIVESIGLGGRFSLRVPDGTYTAQLQLSLSEGPGSPQLVNGRPQVGFPDLGKLTISGGDVTDSIFGPPQVISVRGNVESPGSSGPVLINASAFRAIEQQGCGYSGVESSTVTDSAGQFQIYLQGGTAYDLSALTPITGPNFTGTAFVGSPEPGSVFSSTEDVEGFEIQLGDPQEFVTLAGTVTDVQGQPLEGIWVFANSSEFPEIRNFWFSSSTFTGTDGRYNLQLPKGADYLVQFFSYPPFDP